MTSNDLKVNVDIMNNPSVFKLNAANIDKLKAKFVCVKEVVSIEAKP